MGCVVNAKPIQILAVEDSVVDTERLRGILNQSPRLHFQLQHVCCLADALEAMEADSTDVILLDLTLPDSAGLRTLDTVLKAVPQTPIIVLTHMDDELDAIEAVRRGAQGLPAQGGSGEFGGVAGHCLCHGAQTHRTCTQ